MHQQSLTFPPTNIASFPDLKFNPHSIPYKPSLHPLPSTYTNINTNNPTPIPPIPIPLNLPHIDIYNIPNPCTNLPNPSYYSSAQYEQEKKRFKEIINRPIINKIDPNKKKWKSPIEIAKEFAEIEEILRSDPISLQKRKQNISQIHAIINPKKRKHKHKNKRKRSKKHTHTHRHKHKHKHKKSKNKNKNKHKNETLPIFGKKIQIDKPSQKRKEATNKIANIQYVMTRHHWNKLQNKFNHKLYCKNNNIKLECNDQYYYFNESNDYKLMVKLNKNKHKYINNNTNTNNKRRENKLFMDILSENGGDKYNKLSNYKCLRHKFPSLECMDCGSKLMVIPLNYIGYGNITNNNNENKRVNLYKICAICSNYPNCEFPLYRATYLKYWVRSAYFDHGCEKIEIKKKKRKLEILSDDNDIEILNKKRKLNDDDEKINVNSYNYLQSLSTICSSKDSSISP